MHFTESVENADAWEQERLGDLGKTFTGLSGKDKNDFGHGDAKFVTYMNVFTNPIAKADMVENIEIDSSQYEVQYGDIFFTTSSETPEEVGMSSIWLFNAANIYLNSFCFGFRPTSKFDPYYMGYYLRSDVFRKKMIFLAQGISRYNISKSKVMEIELTIPSMVEQEKIGKIMYTLDSLLTLHQRLHFGITINHLKNPNAWEQHELWKLTIWDKKFNEVDKEKQPETRKYRYALADAINLIIIPGGDIKILSTGSLDAYTTKERAGEYLCNGEIVAIPWGGTPNIKYAKGFFVTGDNRIATSNDLDKLNNRYLYWWFNTPLKHLENIYRGASIKHPSMNDVLNMTIQLPSIPEQKKIIDLLDNIDSLLTFISKCSFTHIIKIFEFTYTIERSLFCFTTFHIIISVSLISKIAMFLFLLIQKQPLGIMFFYI